MYRSACARENSSPSSVRAAAASRRCCRSWPGSCRPRPAALLINGRAGDRAVTRQDRRHVPGRRGCCRGRPRSRMSNSRWRCATCPRRCGVHAPLPLLELVGLRALPTAIPTNFPAGCSQRVAIARCLVQEPRVLLMDEPFAALDEQTRTRMGSELLQIWEKTGGTVVFVTHGLTEAIYLADTVFVMGARPGRIIERITVPLPRPRTIDMIGSEAFGRLRNGSGTSSRRCAFERPAPSARCGWRCCAVRGGGLGSGLPLRAAEPDHLRFAQPHRRAPPRRTAGLSCRVPHHDVRDHHGDPDRVDAWASLRRDRGIVAGARRAFPRRSSRR